MTGNELHFISDVKSQWRLLQHETSQTQQHAYAPGTLRIIYSHWKAFLLFCHYFHVQAIPVHPQVLACFIQYMARNIYSYQT